MGAGSKILINFFLFGFLLPLLLLPDFFKFLVIFLYQFQFLIFRSDVLIFPYNYHNLKFIYQDLAIFFSLFLNHLIYHMTLNKDPNHLNLPDQMD